MQTDHRMISRITLCCAVFLLLGTLPLGAAPLDDYVARPESDFSYQVLGTQTLDGFQLLQVQFTSQRWQNTVWNHRLLVVVPPQVLPTKTALLYISGSGSGNDEVAAMREVAAATRMPAAALLDIPNQPLFGGMREDELIAHTFTKFIETKDPSWLLLFPMAKGAVKALDVYQAIAAERLGLEIEQFVVAGASKRGWTTWLTGAADDRVLAIAPIVYNNLNLIPQMELQKSTFARGASEKIADYTDAGLLELIESPYGQALAAHVDPYAYLDRLSMPKMLLHGTNDPYWPVDAVNLYWDDLVGEKYLVNFPNGGHDLGDLERALRSLAAFVLHVTGQPVLSEVDWTLEQKSDGLPSLQVKRGPSTVGASLYIATSTTRDFSSSQWTKLDPIQTDDGWKAEPLGFPGRYMAFYIDVEYAVGPNATVALSTPIFLIEPGN